MFSVEEEDSLDAGCIIEVGQELMFSTALNTVTNEITVTRGARGTTAAAHSAGDLIKITPAFLVKMFLMQYQTKLKIFILHYLL